MNIFLQNRILGLFVAAGIVLSSLMAFANSSILVLSGGGNPAGNHYSQYLQTKTLYDNLKVRYPSEVSVLFGAGNNNPQAPLLADVHKIQKDPSGQKRAVMVPGVIADNNAATQTNALNYLSTLSTAPPDTFFLFVSDHGMPNHDAYNRTDQSFSNNCINLWGFQYDLKNPSYSGLPFAQQCLSQQQLKQNLPRGKTVFAMSQCFSGGFHQMSVQKDASGQIRANGQICGFTAITEDDTASGCTPDVDGDSYQGYERYFTQQLTGKDVVTGATLSAGKTSLEQAHQAAALQDFTKDIPLSTSDYFLIEWAKTSSRDAQARSVLVKNSKLGDVHGNLVSHPRYAAKIQFYQKMQAMVAKRLPEVSPQLDGDLGALEQTEADLRRQLDSAMQQLWEAYDSVGNMDNQVVMAWRQYALGSTSNLTPAQKMVEDKIFGANLEPLLVMSLAAVTDPQQAEEISLYSAARTEMIYHWARQDAQTSSTMAQLDRIQNDLKTAGDTMEILQKKQGLVRRILKYRTALGMMTVLQQTQNTVALSDLDALLDCEASELK